MIKYFLSSAALLGMTALPAQAATAPSTLNEWLNQAVEIVEDKMTYPEAEAFFGVIDSNRFELTVNRQGDILEFTQRNNANYKSFDIASNKTMSHIDLPDLPESYQGEILSFVLVMNYVMDEDDAEKLTKQSGALQ